VERPPGSDVNGKNHVVNQFFRAEESEYTSISINSTDLSGDSDIFMHLGLNLGVFQTLLMIQQYPTSKFSGLKFVPTLHKYQSISCSSLSWDHPFYHHIFQVGLFVSQLASMLPSTS